ncbi:MAG: hypothetical protein RBS99_09830 [Rhodospirillales bacterium]|jgi:hypothetical protein|nr:hypothetical protein [Rhodospirillales bacterium]
MSGIVGDWEAWVNFAFLAGTGWVAWHGIRYRDAEGHPDLVRLFFAAIAAIFFVMVLFGDVLGVVRL